MQYAHPLNCCQAIFRLPHDLHVRPLLQNATNALPHYGMIIHDQDAYEAGVRRIRGMLAGRPLVRLVWLPVLALCSLVGWSRVYLEVHYPIDVVGGWAAGTIWLTTCGAARALMEPEES